MKVKIVKDTAIFGRPLKAGAEIEVADPQMIHAAVKLAVAEVIHSGLPKSAAQSPKSE